MNAQTQTDECKPFGELSDAEKGALLLAHHEGKKIELLANCKHWTRATPDWSKHCTYRIAPEPLIPDFIDWNHVAPEFNFMARDKNGRLYLFGGEPRPEDDMWSGFGPAAKAHVFASYRRGTVEWKDSLVRRPEASS